MRILITGSSGLIGSALCDALEARGDVYLRLVRSATPGSDTLVRWDPDSEEILTDPRLENLDAAVHLAGHNIACRWTPEAKAAIRNSRVQGTTLLARTFAHLENKPGAFISASAIGYYGETGSRETREGDPPGNDFLASVCREWEEATTPAEEAGIRVAHARFGAVLSGDGGMLDKLLPIFRAGIGGRIGSGRQYMSWIAIDDAIGALLHLIDTSISGPVNLVSPQPVTNADFTRVLAAAVNRPAFLPVPGWAAKLAMGEMAEATALTSSRVLPGVLDATGYRFAYPDLTAALTHVLG